MGLTAAANCTGLWTERTAATDTRQPGGPYPPPDVYSRASNWTEEVVMAIRIDQGERTYELVEGWGELKPGWTWGLVGDVAVDSHDIVHVFTRSSNPPCRIYDRS